MCAPPKIVSVDTKKHAKIFIFSPQRVYKEMYLLSTQNALKNNTQNNASSRELKRHHHAGMMIKVRSFLSLSPSLSSRKGRHKTNVCVCVEEDTLLMGGRRGGLTREREKERKKDRERKRETKKGNTYKDFKVNF